MKHIFAKINIFLAPDGIWYLLICTGVVQRLRQYVANRSLWADEATLANNIVNRGFLALTLPLDGNQGAPIGFLWVEKLFISIFGNRDYILRMFPMLAGLLTIYLMYRVAKLYVGNFGIFALLLLNLSWPVIYYSSEVKQYSTDTMIALLLLWLAYPCFQPAPLKKLYLRLGVAGVLSIWFSHPAALLLGAIGPLLLIWSIIYQSRKQSLWTLILGGVWGFNLIISYIISIHELTINPALKSYWQNDFIPFPPHLGDLSQVYLNLLQASTGVYLPLPWYTLLSLSSLTLFGLCLSDYKSSQKYTLLLIELPFLATLIASVFQVYPIRGRFLLFLAPLVFIILAIGLKEAYEALSRYKFTAHLICGLFIVMATASQAIIITGNFISPPMGEDIKPALLYIQQHKKPNDEIYVYYGGQSAFQYYQTSFGFTDKDVILGIESRSNPEKYKDDVEKLRGKNRVWFLFSHNCDSCIVHEQKYYLQYLGKIGNVIERFNSSDVRLYLFDLNP